MVAGPSKTPVSKAEAESKPVDKGKGKEKDSSGQGEELGRWDVLVRREVAGKPVTVFDVRYEIIAPSRARANGSADGKLLAFGSADLSIGILDAKTLAVCLSVAYITSMLIILAIAEDTPCALLSSDGFALQPFGFVARFG